jgi:pyruvate/2-oxoglutarate/acetoin dehydrogenase E1 component
MLYVESINEGIYELMHNNPDVILIGEDLLDPYGGAFKVSKGLSTQFPKQVISTPISEQAITGAAIGMAMRGMLPIVEIMFGDFLTLCVDQIVNHATKYHWMFNEQVNVPIVIRTPMGGGRGYGPTHSQSLESMFMTVPGLDIFAPSIFHDPGSMLKRCVLSNDHPCLFIESKSAYPKKLVFDNVYKGFTISRIGLNNILLTLYPNEDPDITVITYGGMSELALDCAHELFLEEEIVINILILGHIKPIDKNTILDQVVGCGRILVLEEGNQTGGWGAEVSSVLHENMFSVLKAPVARVGSANSPIPAAMPMEEKVIPSMDILKKSILILYGYTD